MSKTPEIIITNIEKTVMGKVRSSEIVMKPRWIFVVGSILMMVGLVGLGIGIAFLTNLMLFLFRRHGPMGQLRLQLLLDSFPWWIPVLAIVGIVLGIFMLKKYDFSYKKNFFLIIVGFIASIIISAWLIDYLGINEAWSRIGPMRRFYQQLENGKISNPTNQGQRQMENGRSRNKNL